MHNSYQISQQFHLRGSRLLEFQSSFKVSHGILSGNFTERFEDLDVCYFRQINSHLQLIQTFRGCLVYIFKQQFSVFKQYFTHFNALFHPHVFPQIFLNNNFQFLNTYTKRPLTIQPLHAPLVFFTGVYNNFKVYWCLKFY